MFSKTYKNIGSVWNLYSTFTWTKGASQEAKDDGAETESEASASVDAITLARSSSQELSVSDH